MKQEKKFFQCWTGKNSQNFLTKETLCNFINKFFNKIPCNVIKDSVITHWNLNENPLNKFMQRIQTPNLSCKVFIQASSQIQKVELHNLAFKSSNV